MKRARTIGIVAALAVSLGACVSSSPRGPAAKAINRALATAPGKAQPSTIVSTELAYAKAAKTEGFAAAMLEFSAPGAQIHTGAGVVPARAMADGLAAADLQIQWAPRLVVQSCDGSLALSQGRFVDGDALVGNYVTTWARQPKGEFKWTYDASGYDNPQPPPRKEFEDGDIVVTSMDVIEGLVASCPREGETIAPPPPIPAGEGGASAVQVSRDGTLRWRWEHREGGIKYVTAQYYYEGQWLTAIEESLASAIEE